MHQADRTRRPAKERTGEGVLGIAIAKAKFDVTLLLANGKRRRKTVAKTPAGWIELQAWLKRQGGHHVHACREATGTDGDGVATWLHDHGHRVSVINPAIAAAYAKAPLARAKTDRVDADRLADDTATQPPPAWTPRPLEVRELQALGRRRDARLGMQTQEQHRRQAGALVPAVATSIDTVLASLAAEINAVRARIADHINRHPDLRRQRDVLRTLPGIGEPRRRNCSAISCTGASPARAKPRRLQASCRGSASRGPGEAVRPLRSSARDGSATPCTFLRSRRCVATRRSGPWRRAYNTPARRAWSWSAPRCAV
jgi:transposase